MSRGNSQEIVLLAQTTATTSGTGSVINLPMYYTAADVTLNILTVSGTSPTINVYIQKAQTEAASTDLVGAGPTGTVYYQDVISFTQATTSTKVYIASVGPSTLNVVVLNQDGTLTAASVNNGPIGSAWRVKYAVGGTSPSFAFSVSANFLQPTT